MGPRQADQAAAPPRKMTDFVSHGALLRLRCRLTQMPYGWARRADRTSSRPHLPEFVDLSKPRRQKETSDGGGEAAFSSGSHGSRCLAHDIVREPRTSQFRR